ncbi:MucB/RseB C-terminal domain-containing protein [Permianibacter aggregans]|uniref:MucB/RseB-like sigma(E) regulatory protein n=1 Tax=Permianibacter aggregans TaxID=1510150 RepID=A0A4R6UUM0_9GAMM|nr:MucB/RseB C-terminal domain-containing protein [Permianibacter aggregans]QGX41276.1 hypothetical protein E2H98_17035 [Permianibacter aggregans]TDQ51058.1 MucB/RseB-like sigma(E) regulatory protein [Permianibacter aggregans]
MRRWLLIAGLGFAASLAANEPDPKALLDRMARAFRELNYDISFVYIRDNQVEPMRFVHAYEEGRERSRLVHLNGDAREIIRDDDTITAYLADAKPIMVDKAGSIPFTRSLLDNLARIKDSYRLSLGERERIAGRSAQELVIMSPNNDRYGYRIWIDQETGLLLRSELVSDTRQIIEQWQVVNFTANQPIADVELQVSADINPATGVRVLPVAAINSDETVSPFTVDYLPSGFVLRSQQLQRKPGVDEPIHHLLFSDGMAAISVYISKTPAGIRSAERVWRRGGMTIVEKADSERRVTVVGEIPSSTARKIAMSVRASGEPL